MQTIKEQKIGKATARLKSALSEYKCATVPRTIHSLLGVAKGGADPDKRDTGGWNFTHNANNPLPQRFLFLDEGSMPSTDLMASFLAACGGSDSGGGAREAAPGLVSKPADSTSKAKRGGIMFLVILVIVALLCAAIVAGQWRRLTRALSNRERD